MAGGDVMIRRLVGPIIIALGFVSALMVFLGNVGTGIASPSQTGTTLCVDPSHAPPCTVTIQEAIDAANPGDVVIVSAGTFTEHITMTKGVSVIGQGWANTIINGDFSQSKAVVYISDGITRSTVLSGVQVTHGGSGSVTSDVSSGVQGGGIQISYASPTIINTWVVSNTAGDGGGVYVKSGSPIFNNVPVWDSHADRGGGFHIMGDSNVTITSDLAGTNGTILWNSALQDGGGIHITQSSAKISGVRIGGNSATAGGGVSISNTDSKLVSISDSFIGYLFFPNTASNHGGGIDVFQAANLEILRNVIAFNQSTNYGGGAFFNSSAGLVKDNLFSNNSVPSGGGGASTISNNSSDLIIRNNRFEYNSSGQGGALEVDSGAAPLIDANTIISNTAGFGGGIFLYNAGSVSITNNIIARNHGGYGGGIVCNESPAKIINNTIDDNDGDGVFFSDADGIAIVNNIISGNSGNGIESDPSEPTSNFTADYNDLFNNTSANYSGLPAGSNDLFFDPKFEGASPNLFDYYHIQKSSPVSTTGSTTWAPLRDIDSEWRNLFGSVSMGADEVLDGVIITYFPLIFKNYP